MSGSPGWSIATTSVPSASWAWCEDGRRAAAADGGGRVVVVSLLSPGVPTELAASTASAFRAAYGTDPAAVGRAPGRVNLIGEHTDYNAGTCLPVALPHATYAAVSPRADDLVRVRSAQTDDE